MLSDHVLDLLRHDAAGAGADHLLEPADDGEVTVAVELPDVAGVQPAVAQRRARRRLVLPVARHDVAAVDQHFAGLVRAPSRRRAALIARQHTPDRLHEPASPSRVGVEPARRQVAGHRRFGHAVEHADPRAERIERALEDGGRNARAADVDRLAASPAADRAAADDRASARVASAPATCASRRSPRRPRQAAPDRSAAAPRSRRRTGATSG